ncbi:hypothetical protein [Paenibacillus sp. GCM10028914]|uniref:hypothetical protein n=1 Tax=Paenibacillus sp. GCM10028914 TaxID=3273416 RepID=UPI003606D6BA
MKRGNKISKCFLMLSLLLVFFIFLSNVGNSNSTSSTAFATEGTQPPKQSYEYDSLNRLQKVTFYKDGVPYSRHYTYDDNGNVKSITTIPAS